MRKKAKRKRPYFTMESAMTAILGNASGKMHHGILFAPPLRSNIRKRVLSDIQTTARGGLKHETLSTRKSVHLIKFCGVWRPYEDERL